MDPRLLEPIDTPVITRHDNGAVTASHWPPHVLISRELIMHGDRRYLQPDEGGVWIRVANGHARYQFVNVSGENFEAVLDESAWQPER